MKKRYLLLLFVFGLSLSNYAQEAKTILSHQDVVVEAFVEECSLGETDKLEKYYLLKFTNLTNKDIDFKYIATLFYGEEVVLMPTEKGDKAYPHYAIHLPANKTITIDCNSVNKIPFKRLNTSAELVKFRINRTK